MYEQELAHLDRTAFMDDSVEIHDRTAEADMDGVNDSNPYENGKRRGIARRVPATVGLSYGPPEPAGKAKKSARAGRDSEKAQHATSHMPNQKYGRGRRQIS